MDLLRMVAGSDGLHADTVRRAGGRGAYLHRNRDCWTAFVRRRGPVRSLRRTPSRDDRARLVDALLRDAGVA
jgi:predicted RNA-binding protein YlxR (DUF448 family)